MKQSQISDVMKGFFTVNSGTDGLVVEVSEFANTKLDCMRSMIGATITKNKQSVNAVLFISINF